MDRDAFIEAFVDNQDEDLAIMKRKNDDYADGEDPFQNFKMVDNAGLCSVEKGIAVRMSDKLQRIFNLLDSEASVDDETIADTLSDLRNYANILQVWIEREADDDVEITQELTSTSNNSPNVIFGGRDGFDAWQ